jgi:hypothetical protein
MHPPSVSGSGGGTSAGRNDVKGGKRSKSISLNDTAVPRKRKSKKSSGSGKTASGSGVEDGANVNSTNKASGSGKSALTTGISSMQQSPPETELSFDTTHRPRNGSESGLVGSSCSIRPGASSKTKSSTSKTKSSTEPALKSEDPGGGAVAPSSKPLPLASDEDDDIVHPSATAGSNGSALMVFKSQSRGSLPKTQSYLSHRRMLLLRVQQSRSAAMHRLQQLALTSEQNQQDKGEGDKCTFTLEQERKEYQEMLKEANSRKRGLSIHQQPGTGSMSSLLTQPKVKRGNSRRSMPKSQKAAASAAAASQQVQQQQHYGGSSTNLHAMSMSGASGAVQPYTATSMPAGPGLTTTALKQRGTSFSSAFPQHLSIIAPDSLPSMPPGLHSGEHGHGAGGRTPVDPPPGGSKKQQGKAFHRSPATKALQNQKRASLSQKNAQRRPLLGDGSGGLSPRQQQQLQQQQQHQQMHFQPQPQHQKLSPRPRLPVKIPEAEALRQRKKEILQQLVELKKKRALATTGTITSPPLVASSSSVKISSKSNKAVELQNRLLLQQQHIGEQELMDSIVTGPPRPTRLAPRRKTQWDYCMDEIKLVATDFLEERKWKMATARVVSRSLATSHRERERQNEAAEAAVLAAAGVKNGESSRISRAQQNSNDRQMAKSVAQQLNVSMQDYWQTLTQEGPFAEEAGVLTKRMRERVQTREQKPAGGAADIKASSGILVSGIPPPVDNHNLIQKRKADEISPAENSDDKMVESGIGIGSAEVVAQDQTSNVDNSRTDMDQGRDGAGDNGTGTAAVVQESTQSTQSTHSTSKLPTLPTSKRRKVNVNAEVLALSHDDRTNFLGSASQAASDLALKVNKLRKAELQKIHAKFDGCERGLAAESEEHEPEEILFMASQLKAVRWVESLWTLDKHLPSVSVSLPLPTTTKRAGSSRRNSNASQSSSGVPGEDHHDHSGNNGPLVHDSSFKGGAGAILNGTSGTGKTMAATSILWLENDRGPQIVMCSPTNLMRWRHELYKFEGLNIFTFGYLAGLRVEQHEKTTTTSSKVNNKEDFDTTPTTTKTGKSAPFLKAGDVVLCEWSELSNPSFMSKILATTHWATAILDLRHVAMSGIDTCACSRSLDRVNTAKRKGSAVPWWRLISRLQFLDGMDYRKLMLRGGWEWAIAKNSSQPSVGASESTSTNCNDLDVDAAARIVAWALPSVFASPSHVMRWAKRQINFLNKQKRNANANASLSAASSKDGTNTSSANGSPDDLKSLLTQTLEAFEFKLSSGESEMAGKPLPLLLSASDAEVEKAEDSKEKEAPKEKDDDNNNNNSRTVNATIAHPPPPRFVLHGWSIRRCVMGESQRQAYQQLCHKGRGALGGHGLRYIPEAAKMLLRLRQACLHSDLSGFTAAQKEHTETTSSSSIYTKLELAQPNIEKAMTMVKHSSKLLELLRILIHDANITCPYDVNDVPAAKGTHAELIVRRLKESETAKADMGIDDKADPDKSEDGDGGNDQTKEGTGQDNLDTKDDNKDQLETPTKRPETVRPTRSSRRIAAKAKEEEEKEEGAGETDDDTKRPRKVLILATLPEAVSLIHSFFISCGVPHHMVPPPPPSPTFHNRNDSCQAAAFTAWWVYTQQLISDFDKTDDSVSTSSRPCHVLVASPQVLLGTSFRGGLSPGAADYVVVVDEDWSGQQQILHRTLLRQCQTRRGGVDDEEQENVTLVRLVAAQTCEETFVAGHISASACCGDSKQKSGDEKEVDGDKDSSTSTPASEDGRSSEEKKEDDKADADISSTHSGEDACSTTSPETERRRHPSETFLDNERKILEESKLSLMTDDQGRILPAYASAVASADAPHQKPQLRLLLGRRLLTWRNETLSRVMQVDPAALPVSAVTGKPASFLPSKSSSSSSSESFDASDYELVKQLQQFEQQLSRCTVQSLPSGIIGRADVHSMSLRVYCSKAGEEMEATANISDEAMGCVNGNNNERHGNAAFLLPNGRSRDSHGGSSTIVQKEQEEGRTLCRAEALLQYGPGPSLPQADLHPSTPATTAGPDSEAKEGLPDKITSREALGAKDKPSPSPDAVISNEQSSLFANIFASSLHNLTAGMRSTLQEPLLYGPPSFPTPDITFIAEHGHDEDGLQGLDGLSGADQHEPHPVHSASLHDPMDGQHNQHDLNLNPDLDQNDDPIPIDDTDGGMITDDMKLEMDLDLIPDLDADMLGDEGDMEPFSLIDTAPNAITSGDGEIDYIDPLDDGGGVPLEGIVTTDGPCNHHRSVKNEHVLSVVPLPQLSSVDGDGDGYDNRNKATISLNSSRDIKRDLLDHLLDFDLTGDCNINLDSLRGENARAPRVPPNSVVVTRDSDLVEPGKYRKWQRNPGSSDEEVEGKDDCAFLDAVILHVSKPPACKTHLKPLHSATGSHASSKKMRHTAYSFDATSSSATVSQATAPGSAAMIGSGMYDANSAGPEGDGQPPPEDLLKTTDISDRIEQRLQEVFAKQCGPSVHVRKTRGLPLVHGCSDLDELLKNAQHCNKHKHVNFGPFCTGFMIGSIMGPNDVSPVRSGLGVHLPMGVKMQQTLMESTSNLPLAKVPWSKNGDIILIGAMLR